MSSSPQLDKLKRDLDAIAPRSRDWKATTEAAKPERGQRGRTASDPRQIPAPGWKDIMLRAWSEVSENNIFLASGGVTYAVLLALFPVSRLWCRFTGCCSTRR